jgi:hypothetical protein
VKRLIISPQAGMCNRFRAMSAALVLGTLSGRKVFHNWCVDPPWPGEIEILRQMRESTFETFFAPTRGISKIAVDKSTPIDVVFSEWGPGDAAFPAKSAAIRRAGHSGTVRVERRNADSILQSEADTVLLETSLAMKPSSMNDAEFNAKMTEMYQEHFVPQARYLEALGKFSRGRSWVGLHIRRADLVTVHRSSRLRLHDWVNLITQQVKEGESILLCSDDDRFAKKVVAANPRHSFWRPDFGPGWEPKEKAFLDFLALSQSIRIFGTVQSSFSIEAARFGGVSCQQLRSNRPTFVKKLRRMTSVRRRFGRKPPERPTVELVPSE